MPATGNCRTSRSPSGQSEGFTSAAAPESVSSSIRTGSSANQAEIASAEATPTGRARDRRTGERLGEGVPGMRRRPVARRSSPKSALDSGVCPCSTASADDTAAATKNALIPPRESDRKIPTTVKAKTASHPARSFPRARSAKPKAGHAASCRKPARWLGLTKVAFGTSRGPKPKRAATIPRTDAARPVYAMARSSVSPRSRFSPSQAAAAAAAATATATTSSIAVSPGASESGRQAGHRPTGASVSSKSAAALGERSRRSAGGRGTSWSATTSAPAARPAGRSGSPGVATGTGVAPGKVARRPRGHERARATSAASVTPAATSGSTPPNLSAPAATATARSDAAAVLRREREPGGTGRC